MAYADKFTDELQLNFIVIQWDQRETGKTKSLNTSAARMTVSLFEGDAIDVINYLRNKFHQEKIYLAGHSWGGFLALQLAAHHPDLFRACFAAAPMIHQVVSEKMALDKMTATAKEENNTKALRELASIKIPFENGTQLYYHRKWLYKLLNRKNPPFSIAYVDQWAGTWLPLFNEASAINFFETVPEIQCPVYFLVGTNDYQANFQLTENYFQKVKAEKKELFWFTNSAHSLNLTEPRKFQEVMIQVRNQQ